MSEGSVAPAAGPPDPDSQAAPAGAEIDAIGEPAEAASIEPLPEERGPAPDWPLAEDDEDDDDDDEAVAAVLIALLNNDGEALADALDEVDDESLEDAITAWSKRFENVLQRNPGLGAEEAERAKDAFGEAAREHPRFASLLRVLSDYAAAAVESDSASEQMTRAAFDTGMPHAQRAAAIFRRLASKTLPKALEAENDPVTRELLERFAQELKRDLIAAESLSAQLSLRSALARDDYGAAYREANEWYNISDRLLDLFPEDDPLRPLIEVGLYRALAEREVCFAMTLRRERRWDEALDAYTRGRDAIEEAALKACDSSLPGAQAMQEALLSYPALVIERGIRDCQQERALREELETLRAEYEDFRREIVTRLGANVSVTTTAQANPNVSTDQRVLTKVDQMTQVVQNVEASVRDELRSLASELAQADLASPEQAAELSREAQGLAQDPGEGVAFLEKAKAFTGRMVDILKNTQGATGAVLGTATTLVKLLGLVGIVL